MYVCVSGGRAEVLVLVLWPSGPLFGCVSLETSTILNVCLLLSYTGGLGQLGVGLAKLLR